MNLATLHERLEALDRHAASQEKQKAVREACAKMRRAGIDPERTLGEQLISVPGYVLPDREAERELIHQRSAEARMMHARGELGTRQKSSLQPPVSEVEFAEVARERESWYD